MTRRTLIFDIGGVVVQWQPLQLMRQWLPEQARDDDGARAAAANVFQSFAQRSDWALFDLGRIEPEALAVRIAARTGYPLPRLRQLIEAIPAHLQPMPESVALLERVRAQGHRLALLSNMPRPYARHLEAQHACFAWFEARVFSGFVGLIKPQPAMFEHAQRALAFELGDALFIDDHPGNVGAAKACGWQALHFANAAQCEAELQRGGWL